MENKIKDITSYFRSAVAAQVNRKIDFKDGEYYYFTFSELINGKIDASAFEMLVKEPKIKDQNKPEIETVNVIIVVKTIKTIFDSQERKNSEIEDLTGIYYVPAILTKYGMLEYDESKLPWIPREFLEPMIEPQLSMGNYKDFDEFISNSLGRIHKIKKWTDYIEFVRDIYESVTKAKFEENKLLNVDLDKNIYILKDETINATKAVLKLYDSMIDDYTVSKLYENFISLHFKKTVPLIPNDLEKMKIHCGQMGGEHPLSPSQRECVNHFTNMKDGEILAVNGPPGTGKTTLLQSIVANMYVERALKKEKPPLIVATSTNNQAVTNIIESFGKIERLGYRNLEERWIEGVKSFAVYFPSLGTKNEKEAKNKGYHYTNLTGTNFISDIETDENILKSKEKFLMNFNKYFNCNVSSLDDCENTLHEWLIKINSMRIDLLILLNKFKSYGIINKTIEEHLLIEKKNIEVLKEKISSSIFRVEAWKKHFKEIPLLYKLLKFFKGFRRKIETKNRIFIESYETFLNENMSLDEIEEKYSYIIREEKNNLDKLKKIYEEIEELKEQYDNKIQLLNKANIDIFEREKNKNVVNLDQMNNIMDKTLRYIEFWLSVHYYECRWAKGEDCLKEKQKGKTYANVLEKLYNRLSMVTPCYVMTLYQLPKNFLAFGDNKHFHLYNFIDLLIVDEAGQVSPEIAACSFSLAKKAVVVGDIYQIEPVWSVSEALDKSIAIDNGVIEKSKDYEKLMDLGINASNSSVMLLAAKSCQYIKNDNRGLFLSEHRRCYDEIISYCKDLVYKKLEPMRGNGLDDKDYKLISIPQIGYKQIETEYSMKKGGSRFNKIEAIEIANWINENFEMIRNAYPNENIKNLVGVITPFKVQVSCIRNGINKKIPEHIGKNISVGTVHTFQGAERRIIIMSTVYGGNEKCYFIDANKSMLNVAVSRAKDCFLVFGDINSFSNDENSASGLLKKYIINNNI